jgi:cyclic beta-1,2-glucan synthetase
MRNPREPLIHLPPVVQRQIKYGDERQVPWGVSESAYNVRDLGLTYQYSNFGVPGLGLKRGLFEDVVVAPYATALAAMVNPKAALHNFDRLRGLGALGKFGFMKPGLTTSRLPGTPHGDRPPTWPTIRNDSLSWATWFTTASPGGDSTPIP